MKKLILSVFILFTFFSYSQDLVSIVPSSRTALIEEFTAVGCGNCPTGHSITSTLESENLNKVISIRYHHGFLANPSGDNLDFRTSFSDSLALQAELVGQPLATVNRNIFDGLNKTSLSIFELESSCSEIISQEAVVNIGANAIIDSSTNELEINIELYYTGNQLVNTNLLNVALLQNNIIATQAVYSVPTPNDFLENGLYSHKYVLRHLITGQWGIPVEINEGPLISEKINYSIPLEYRNISVNLENLELVIFVNEDRQQVLNAIKITPEFGSLQSSSVIEETSFKVRVYPNPVNRNAIININNLSNDIDQIQIIDVTGKLLYSNKKFNETDNVLLQDLDYKPGIYFIQFLQKNQIISNEKLIIH